MIVEEYNGIENIARELKCDLKKGIEPHTIKDRINDFGPNKFAPPKIKSLVELIFENFEDKINQILFVAAIVSSIIGYIQHGLDGLIEGVSILIALVIIITVNSGNNYVSERRLAELVQLSDK